MRCAACAPRLLLQAGDAELAKHTAEGVVQVASEAGVDMRPDTRAHRMLALARATLGDTQGAIACLAPLLAAVEAEGTATVRAGQLYEARARIALMA